MAAQRWPAHFHVSAGLSEDGRILECFLAGGGKNGTDLNFLIEDAAVVISRLLQHGDSIDTIAKGLGRLPDGSPASVIGAVMERSR